MKKILTVSLFAMMAVSAANADIASTDYVNTAKTAAISAAATDATTKANQAKADAIAAIPAVDSTFSKDSNNAATSKAIAGYISGELGVLNVQQEGINASIGELEADIAAINHKDTGILALAKADATSKANAAQSAAEATAASALNTYKSTNDAAVAEAKKAGDDAQADVNALKTTVSNMDTAYKAADTAIKNTIGTVDEGKTVVEMISEAQTNATYDDTEVRGLITTNKNNISAMDTAYKAADTALGNRLTTAEGKITTIEGQQTTQDGKISTLETSLSATGTTGKAIADNKKAIADMDTAYKAADTTTLNSAKAFTTEQIEALGKLATIDTACAQGVTDCALVIRSGEIKWEKVSY